MNRRTYIKAGGLAGVAGGLLVGGLAIRGLGEGGPENPSDWRQVFYETFEDGLASGRWDVGWGWGRTTTTSPTRISADDVSVEDGALRLSGSLDGGRVTAGAVNTKDRVTFGPGSYVEAEIRFASQVGFLNAFWSKPNTEAWPPELDVVELWQDGSGPDDTHASHHHLHYSHSTEPGDDSTHVNRGVTFRPGDDLTSNFHVYAAEWLPDRIVHYVDGEAVRRWTDERMLAAMRRGAPFYMMLSVNIDKIGTADRSEPWDESMDVDWVRLWERK